jgi:TonB-dependent SusC/RagA subfamily outer membrane receptor
LLNNLSSVYAVDKKIKQRENQGVWVLDKNVCPAVILECGYISNTDDRNYISSKANQEKIAKQILRSIEDYFSKAVLIQPSAATVQIANDTTPKAKTKEKTPPAKVTFLYLNGNSETLTIKEYRDRTGREDITFMTDTIKLDGNSLAKKKDDGSLKYLVDGKEVNAAVANSINPDNIASVNVTKGGSENTVNIITKNVDASNKKLVLTLPKSSPPPLYILNGDEISEEEMKLIDPNKIESISVLKDKSAETIYGEKGKNGVIVITLKKQ